MNWANRATFGLSRAVVLERGEYSRPKLLVKTVLALLILAMSQPALARYAALVVDADSGDALFSRHADERRYPASLTKIMTLYMVFDALERGKLTLDQNLHVSKRAQGQTPSKLKLKAGNVLISVRVDGADRTRVAKAILERHGADGISVTGDASVPSGEKKDKPDHMDTSRATGVN